MGAPDRRRRIAARRNRRNAHRRLSATRPQEARPANQGATQGFARKQERVQCRRADGRHEGEHPGR